MPWTHYDHGQLSVVMMLMTIQSNCMVHHCPDGSFPVAVDETHLVVTVPSNDCNFVSIVVDVDVVAVVVVPFVVHDNSKVEYHTILLSLTIAVLSRM